MSNHSNQTGTVKKVIPLPVKETDEEIIERLAALSEMDYDRVRKSESKAIGIKVATLDKLVEAERSNLQQTATLESIVEELEPWPKPIQAEALLNQMVNLIKRFVILQPGVADAIALWILASYCMGVWSIFPKLLIHSPDMRCGKTTLIEVLEMFAYRALMASNISSSAIFRCIELYSPTLFLDEADTFMKGNEEMNGIINAGHKKRAASTIRTEKIDGHFIPVKYSVWCPQVIACIGEQKRTLHDRALSIELQRKKTHEKVEKLPINAFEQGFEFRQKCLRWADDNADALKKVIKIPPNCGNDRAQDNWGPLFAVAEVVGPKWFKRVEKSYLLMTTAAANAPISLGTELLSDIRYIYQNRKTNKIFSEDLVSTLLQMKDRPWPDIGNGKSLNQSSLAKILKPYNCKPRSVRIASGTKKGYHLSDFKDTFERYL